jgi:hypothetical protein
MVVVVVVVAGKERAGELRFENGSIGENWVMSDWSAGFLTNAD